MSWQNHLLTPIVRYFSSAPIKKKQTSRNLLKWVHKVRHQSDLGTRFLPVPKSIARQSFYIEQIATTWYLPPNPKPDTAILYLHGGGYTFGSAKTHGSLAARLAQTCKIPVLLPEYRLAPEHPHPAALVDALASYRWLIQQGYQRIIVAGDSAGGGLSLALLQHLAHDKSASNLLQPQCGVLLSPWADLELRHKSMVDNIATDAMVSPLKLQLMANLYAADMPLNTPSISPIHGRFDNLPPLLLQSSTSEILRDDSRAIAQKAEEQKSLVQLQEWRNMIHVWQLFWYFLPEGKAAIDQIAAFITQQLNEF